MSLQIVYLRFHEVLLFVNPSHNDQVIITASYATTKNRFFYTNAPCGRNVRLHCYFRRLLKVMYAVKDIWGLLMRDFYRPDALPVTQPTVSKHITTELIVYLRGPIRTRVQALVLSNGGSPRLRARCTSLTKWFT